MNSDDQIESLDRTVLQVGDAEVPITLKDAKAMQRALVDYLKKSDYEDRERLLGETERDTAWIDSDGDIRIGLWLLDSDDSDIILRYREPPGSLAGKAHVAVLSRKGGTWTLKEMRTERIKVRR